VKGGLYYLDEAKRVDKSFRFLGYSFSEGDSPPLCSTAVYLQYNTEAPTTIVPILSPAHPP
jgi:hypothetical protein